MKILVLIFSLITSFAYAQDTEVNPADSGAALVPTHTEGQPMVPAFNTAINQTGVNMKPACIGCVTPENAGQIVEGILTDSSGNAVKDGSGEAVKSMGQ